MHHFDLKVYLLTGTALLVSATQVETFLRFTLLTLSIIYTGYKIYDRYVEKKNTNKEDDRIL